MSTVKREGWTGIPTRPVYVRFDPNNITRTRENNDGITLRGVTAGFSKTETLPTPENGQLTIYDNYFGYKDKATGVFPDEQRPLTMPLKLYQNDKGYWEAHPAGDVVLADVLAATPAKPYEPGGAGGRSGGATARSSLTLEDIDRLHDRALAGVLATLGQHGFDLTGLTPDNISALTAQRMIPYQDAADAGGAAASGAGVSDGPPGPAPADADYAADAGVDVTDIPFDLDAPRGRIL